MRVVSAETGFEKLPYALTMAVAPTKNSERFEWFLEKATEVGVTAVVPLETEHSERRVFKPSGREGRHRGAETVAQGLPPRAASAHPLPRSGAVGPRGAEVHRPLRPGAVARREGLPGPRAPSGARRATVFIGPGGDFSPGEIAFALANGFEEITLGRQRLRTETAALAAVVMASVVNG